MSRLQGELASERAERSKLQTDLRKSEEELSKALGQLEGLSKAAKRQTEASGEMESRCSDLEKEKAALVQARGSSCLRLHPHGPLLTAASSLRGARQVENELRRELSARCKELESVQQQLREAGASGDRLRSALQDLSNLQQRADRDREESAHREGRQGANLPCRPSFRPTDRLTAPLPCRWPCSRAQGSARGPHYRDQCPGVPGPGAGD